MHFEGNIFLDFYEFVPYLFKVVFPTTKSTAILYSILSSFSKAVNELFREFFFTLIFLLFTYYLIKLYVNYIINTNHVTSFGKKHNLFLFGIQLEWDRRADTGWGCLLPQLPSMPLNEKCLMKKEKIYPSCSIDSKVYPKDMELFQWKKFKRLWW